MAANLRPTLPGCASAMARNPVRGSIMNDGTPSRHRADLPWRPSRLLWRLPAGAARTRGDCAHVFLGPSGADGTVFSRSGGPQLQNSPVKCVRRSAEVHRAASSPQGPSATHPAHSGNPAFRRPSIISFQPDVSPGARAINADIVKVGSSSSKRAAAPRASASRPRWAKADARQR